MRNTLLLSCILAGTSACAIEIHGGKWGIDIGDTGSSVDLDADTGLEDPDFLVTPNQLYAGMNEVLTITAESVTDWTQLRRLTAIGDIEIIARSAEGAELWVGIVVPEKAVEGPAHLVFEFEDGEVYMVRDALYIEGLQEEDPSDTGLVGDEPTED
jgi:hypothetical protein